MQPLKPIPPEIEIQDSYDYHTMTGPLEMWPSAAVQLLTLKVNELVERVNELSRLIGDDGK